MIAFKIDELTPCLTDALTGETFQTEVVELKRKSFLSKLIRKPDGMLIGARFRWASGCLPLSLREQWIFRD